MFYIPENDFVYKLSRPFAFHRVLSCSQNFTRNNMLYVAYNNNSGNNNKKKKIGNTYIRLK